MDLNKHLANAADAVKRRNYPFAIKLYGQLLALQPDSGEARAGLRTALFKKAEAKKPSRLFAMIGGGVHLLTAAIARLIATCRSIRCTRAPTSGSATRSSAPGTRARRWRCSRPTPSSSRAVSRPAAAPARCCTRRASTTTRWRCTSRR
jgi:hypothetical protein